MNADYLHDIVQQYPDANFVDLGVCHDILVLQP